VSFGLHFGIKMRSRRHHGGVLGAVVRLVVKRTCAFFGAPGFAFWTPLGALEGPLGNILASK